MHRTFSFTVTLVASLTFSLTSVLLADVYQRIGAGDLRDGKWLNQTTSPPGGPNVFGSPGAGDDGYFLGTITASGGSVHLLSGRETQLPTRETARYPEPTAPLAHFRRPASRRCHVCHRRIPAKRIEKH